jgi:hypothetical protein
VSEQHEPVLADKPAVEVTQAMKGAPEPEAKNEQYGDDHGHAHIPSTCSHVDDAASPAVAREYAFTTTGMPSLDAFFKNSVPYLRGEITPKQFVENVGPSASTLKRLNIYPWIVLHDNRNSYNKMFVAARAAVERYKLGLWDRMMSDYQRRYPPSDWRIHRMGMHMYEFFKEYREAHADFPEYIEQLADCAYTRGLAGNAPPVDDPTQWIDRTIFVRQYTHSVPQFVIQINDDPDAPSPEPRPQLALIYRSFLTLRSRIYYPGVVALLALAKRTNTSPELRERFTQITDEQIEQGDAALVEHGVLPAKA